MAASDYREVAAYRTELAFHLVGIANPSCHDAGLCVRRKMDNEQSLGPRLSPTQR